MGWDLSPDLYSNWFTHKRKNHLETNNGPIKWLFLQKQNVVVGGGGATEPNLGIQQTTAAHKTQQLFWEPVLWMSVQNVWHHYHISQECC